jgi:large subunit ribosomal protein L19
MEPKETKFPEFHPGDVIRVMQKIKEGDKERLQAFEGTVISMKGAAESRSFTVRRLSAGGIGVERIWHLNSPHIDSITVKIEGDVRRAKLYYLRDKKTKRDLRTYKVN